MEDIYEKKDGLKSKLSDILNKVYNKKEDLETFGISFGLGNLISALAMVGAYVDSKIHPNIKNLNFWEALLSGEHFFTWLYLQNPAALYVTIMALTTLILYAKLSE